METPAGDWAENRATAGILFVARGSRAVFCPFRCDTRREGESARVFDLQQHHGRGPLFILYRAFAQQEDYLRGGRGDEHSGGGEDARVRRVVSRAGRGAFAVARDWAGPAEDQESD